MQFVFDGVEPGMGSMPSIPTMLNDANIDAVMSVDTSSPMYSFAHGSGMNGMEANKAQRRMARNMQRQQLQNGVVMPLQQTREQLQMQTMGGMGMQRGGMYQQPMMMNGMGGYGQQSMMGYGSMYGQQPMMMNGMNGYGSMMQQPMMMNSGYGQMYQQPMMMNGLMNSGYGSM